MTSPERLLSIGQSGAATVTVARLLQNANGFLLSIIIVRQFGLSAAGALAIASVPTVLFGTICTLGLHYTLAHAELTNRQKNLVGALGSLGAFVLSIPMIALFALAEASDHSETVSIFLLGLGGPFFAQTNVLNALLVLQDRASLIILSPVGNLIGLGIGYLLGGNLAEFCLILAFGRILGIAAIFLCLPLSRVSFFPLFQLFRKGLAYLFGDVLNMGSDQLTVLISAQLLMRADLGILGLARQMVTVCDTPSWSRIITWYPRLHIEPERHLPAWSRAMFRLGAGCAAVTATLAILMGLFIYHLPRFTWLAPILIAAAPLRSVLTLFDAMLRAVGAVAAVNRVTFIRCLAVLGIVPLGIAGGGVLGAILALVAHASWACWITGRALSERLRARTPTPPPNVISSETLASYAS